MDPGGPSSVPCVCSGQRDRGAAPGHGRRSLSCRGQLSAAAGGGCGHDALGARLREGRAARPRLHCPGWAGLRAAAGTTTPNVKKLFLDRCKHGLLC